jgi:hypothetical protein
MLETNDETKRIAIGFLEKNPKEIDMLLNEFKKLTI